MTPVRTGPLPTPACRRRGSGSRDPTSTPATSVIAFRGPGVPVWGMPSSRARGLDWAGAEVAAARRRKAGRRRKAIVVGRAGRPGMLLSAGEVHDEWEMVGAQVGTDPGPKGAPGAAGQHVIDADGEASEDTGPTKAATRDGKGTGALDQCS